MPFKPTTPALGTTTERRQIPTLRVDASYALLKRLPQDAFTGNLRPNFNHLNIFIADNRAGQSTLSRNNQLATMNGSNV